MAPSASGRGVRHVGSNREERKRKIVTYERFLYSIYISFINAKFFCAEPPRERAYR